MVIDPIRGHGEDVIGYAKITRDLSDRRRVADTRKGYIRSIIDAVEVDDQAIRIIGSKEVLQAAIAGKQTENGNLLGFVRKWRTRHDSNV